MEATGIEPAQRGCKPHIAALSRHHRVPFQDASPLCEGGEASFFIVKLMVKPSTQHNWEMQEAEIRYQFCRQFSTLFNIRIKDGLGPVAAFEDTLTAMGGYP